MQALYEVNYGIPKKTSLRQIKNRNKIAVMEDMSNLINKLILTTSQV